MVGFISRRSTIAGYGGASVLSTLSIALFAFAAGSLLREGTICIVMAIPIFVVVAVIGAIIGIFVGDQNGPKGPMLLSAIVLIPGLLAPIENELPQQTVHQSTVRSIYIKAPPEVIWRHLNFPLDINPANYLTALHIVSAFPIRSKHDHRRPCRWQTRIALAARRVVRRSHHRLEAE